MPSKPAKDPAAWIAALRAEHREPVARVTALLAAHADVWEQISGSAAERAEAALRTAIDDDFASAATIVSHAPALRAIAQREDLPLKAQLLRHLPDDASFRLVLSQLRKQLVTEYYDTKPIWFRVAGVMARRSRSRADVLLAILRRAYRKMTARAASADSLRNSVGWVAVATACVELGDARGAAIVIEGLEAIDEDAHYELMCTFGPLAVALSRLPTTGAERTHARRVIASFLTQWGDTYEGEPFIVEAQYAAWVLAQDAEGPRAVLAASRPPKSLGLVATAVADLDDKPSLPLLEQKLPTLTNTVTKEVFKEAIGRLRTQKRRPPPADRMIALFGVVSATEIELGVETDNVFFARAKQAPPRGEADNAAPED